MKKQLEEEIKTLRQYVVNLKKDKDELQKEIQLYKEQIKKLSDNIILLDNELRMRKLQEDAKKKYSDDSKNY